MPIVNMEPFPQRFWRYVAVGPEDCCWPWQGTRNRGGYGEIRDIGRGPKLRTHRVAYKLCKGPIPGGMVVMHTCDNRACCNPAHLRVGTMRDNSLDMVAKGRNPPWQRKLTAEKAAEIKALAGKMRDQEIADKYGVARTTVRLIIRGKSWARVSAAQQVAA